MLIRHKRDWNKYKKTFENKLFQDAIIVHTPDLPFEFPCLVSSTLKLNGYDGIVLHRFFYKKDARELIKVIHKKVLDK